MCSIFQAFKPIVENKFSTRIKVLRSDGGGIVNHSAHSSYLLNKWEYLMKNHAPTYTRTKWSCETQTLTYHIIVALSLMPLYPQCPSSSGHLSPALLLISSTSLHLSLPKSQKLLMNCSIKDQSQINVSFLVISKWFKRFSLCYNMSNKSLYTSGHVFDETSSPFSSKIKVKNRFCINS